MSKDASKTKIPRQVWKTAVLGGMASYLDGGAMVTGGIALAMVLPTLGLSPWDLGILSAMLTGGLAIGALIGGRLGDKFGRKRVFSVDLLLLALGLALNMTAVNSVMLYAGIAITGLAMGADLPVSISLVAEAAPPEHRGKLVGFSQLLWGIGPAVVIIINAICSQTSLSPTIQARILWAHLFIVALVVWFLRRRLPESSEWLTAASGERITEDSEVAEHLANAGAVDRAKLRLLLPFAVPLAATGLFYTIGNLTPSTGGQFSYYILTQVAGMPAPKFSLLMLTLVPLGIILNLAFMRVVDTRFRNLAMIIGGVLGVAAYLVPSLLGVTIPTFLLAFYGGLIGSAFIGEGLYKVRTQEIFPTLVRSTAQGFTIFVCRILTALFALVTPAIATSNLHLLVWLLAGFNLVTLFLGLWVSRIKSADDVQGLPVQVNAPSTVEA